QPDAGGHGRTGAGLLRLQVRAGTDPAAGLTPSVATGHFHGTSKGPAVHGRLRRQPTTPPGLFSREASRAVKARFYSPCAACATARNRARPLLMVSSHSAAGSESCTM